MGSSKPLGELLGARTRRCVAADTVVFLGDYIDRGLRDEARCVGRRSWQLNGRAAVRHRRMPAWQARGLVSADAGATTRSFVAARHGRPTTRSRSYSADAAHAIACGRAPRRRRRRCTRGTVRAALRPILRRRLPAAHRAFFETLRTVRRDGRRALHARRRRPALGGSLGDQGPRADLGRPWVPGRTTPVTAPSSTATMNTRQVDADDWPRPRMVRNTYGLDTIAHGVLTAIRLPGPGAARAPATRAPLDRPRHDADQGARDDANSVRCAALLL